MGNGLVANADAGVVNVGYLLAQRARIDGGREAIEFGDATLSYRELNTRACRLARGLMAEGVEKGDRVAVLLGNTAEYYELLFACAKLGAILVTVNYRLVSHEVQYLLDDCTPRVLVFGSSFAEVVADLDLQRTGTTPVVLGEAGGCRRYEECLSDDDSELPVAVGLEDPLIIMYTSGTTGRSKGAVLSHKNVLFTSFNQITDWSLTKEDRCLVVAPLYHVGGLLILAFPALHLGGRVTIEPGFDPRRTLESIAAERITTLFMAPTMWNMLLAEEGLEDFDVSSVRLCCSGGEALPVPVMERLITLFGTDFTEGYGLTEASSCSTVLRAEHVIAKTGAVGTPFTHNAVRVVDEHGRDVPTGERGEIVQAGPTVMQGYWNRPEATAEALRDGWLRTGDMGMIDADGFLWIVDRMKDMIISGAENVYPAEVEEVIYQHPDVVEAAVIGLPDPKWGEAVTAVVVLRDGSAADPDELLEFCRERMAGYKRPRRVILVDALPRNPSGKVLKRELRDSCVPGDAGPATGP